MVGKTTAVGQITPPDGFELSDLFTYNTYSISSGDVNYGAFLIMANNPTVFFTYLKHGFNNTGISLKVIWKK